MTQNQLNREIANATGETVDRIKRLGLTLTVVPQRRHWPHAGENQIRTRRVRRSNPLNVTIHQSKAA